MTDPNMQDFQGRIRRIHRIHDSGGGFEAEGTLGLSYYNSHRPRLRRQRLLSLVLVFVLVLLVMKTGMQLALGPDIYIGRIEALRHGTASDRMGAFILQPDRISGALAAWLQPYLARGL